MRTPSMDFVSGNDSLDICGRWRGISEGIYRMRTIKPGQVADLVFSPDHSAALVRKRRFIGEDSLEGYWAKLNDEWGGYMLYVPPMNGVNASIAIYCIPGMRSNGDDALFAIFHSELKTIDDVKVLYVRV